MTQDQFPRVPIDTEAIARARERVRQQIRDAPPASDPLIRELQENIANGIRGRDLLNISAYREFFGSRAEELTSHVRRLREKSDEQTGREVDGDAAPQ